MLRRRIRRRRRRHRHDRKLLLEHGHIRLHHIRRRNRPHHHTDAPANILLRLGLQPSLAHHQGQTYPQFAVAVEIEQAARQPDPTATLPIQFDVAFDQPVTGFDSGDLQITGAATGVQAALSGSGMFYTVWITQAGTAGNIQVAIHPRVCKTNNFIEILNNPSTSTDNSVTYTIPQQMPLAAWPAVPALLTAGLAIIRTRRRV